DTLLLRQWVGETIRAPVACIAVCHDQWSAENYYHWLIDTLPRLLVLRQTHPQVQLLLPQPLPPKRLPDYITYTAQALGFTNYLPLTTRQILHASCVVLPELTAASLTQHPGLVRQVQAELIAALQPSPVVGTRKVYAARATHGVRRIANEAAVDELLQAFGFEKIYFEKMSFLEQVQLMRETKVFLGVHGAGMTNMLFLQPDTAVIELLNEEHGDLCYFRLASCISLPYFWIPCAGTHQQLANQSDIIVSAELLKQAVVAAIAQL
ncbi:MAG: glycosyltransferase family 61 protein, partial [Hymenobacter sp.]